VIDLTRSKFVAAMNPCPCGWLGDPSDRCHCAPPPLARYRARVSGALLDRIDLHGNVPRVPVASLAGDGHANEARTIADLAQADQLTTRHLAEAIQYRSLDRSLPR
jgi:magnesium chelatase family protein